MKLFIASSLLILAVTARSQNVQDFNLVNVVDGKIISLSTFKSCQGIAIIFTSNECPFDNQYRERIKLLNDQYKGAIQFLLINSHMEPRENAKAMGLKHPGWGLPIPYLADKDQIAMAYLGASKSPEAFLLKKNGTAYTIVYHGALDDNPLVNSDVNNAYLRIAIDRLLTNAKTPSTSNRVAGCTIRKKQQ